LWRGPSPISFTENAQTQDVVTTAAPGIMKQAGILFLARQNIATRANV
jgi:hypothetical protein